VLFRSVGANNNYEEVPNPLKETLFSKVVNYGNTRLSVEAGEPGDSFINIRIDDVLQCEKTIPAGSGATPAVVGNLFKMQVSDKGAIEIRSGGKGIPGANINGFHMSVNEDGKLIIHAAAGIEITHGDADSGINSISKDPTKGIDITAQSGFRVNGKELVNSNFFDWFTRNATIFILPVTPPGPGPINPIALTDMNINKNVPDIAGGFVTKGVPIPATKIIQDTDIFSSV